MLVLVVMAHCNYVSVSCNGSPCNYVSVSCNLSPCNVSLVIHICIAITVSSTEDGRVFGKVKQSPLAIQGDSIGSSRLNVCGSRRRSVRKLSYLLEHKSLSCLMLAVMIANMRHERDLCSNNRYANVRDYGWCSTAMAT